MRSFTIALAVLMAWATSGYALYWEGHAHGQHQGLRTPCATHTPNAVRRPVLNCTEVLRTCRARARMEKTEALPHVR